MGKIASVSEKRPSPSDCRSTAFPEHLASGKKEFTV
jgi:hypothetical protein